MVMKIKIKIFLFTVFVFSNLSAQKNKFLYKEAKGVALCQCLLSLNNNSDTKDYSLSYFIQNSDLDINITNKIISYTIKNSNHYRIIPQEPDGNMINYSCWKFYESKELDNYIKKLLKEES